MYEQVYYTYKLMQKLYRTYTQEIWQVRKWHVWDPNPGPRAWQRRGVPVGLCALSYILTRPGVDRLVNMALGSQLGTDGPNCLSDHK